MFNHVIIRRGDNLWRIARRNYGRGIKYKAIYAANQHQIRNPHRIYPGQVFVVPTRDRGWEATD
jgi:nucleoid-associated protein YgaU